MHLSPNCDLPGICISVVKFLLYLKPSLCSVLCPPLALFSGVLQYFFPLVYSFHVNLSSVTSLLFGICLGYLIHADYPYGQLSPTPWMDTRWRGAWADHARVTALGSNPWPVAIYNSSLPSWRWKGSSPTTWSLHGIR